MRKESRAPEGFRDRVRAWLAEHAPTGDLLQAGDADSVDQARDFIRDLHTAGLSGLTWPTAYGGQGLHDEAQRIFDDEARDYPLPLGTFGSGLAICGPSILALGTEEQKQRLLPPILDGSAIWCQLFSEPAAGSDIANVQTRAVADGADFVVTGQKVWTTFGHLADWALLIARTDPDRPRHHGLTMFALDMRSPGVTVNGLRDASGITVFSEVFLDDVRVHRDAIVGELHGAWDVVRVGLAHERLAMGAGLGDGPRATSPLAAARLVRSAERAGVLDVAWPELLDQILLERSTELLSARIERLIGAGIDPGVRGSVTKVVRGRLEIAAAELAGRLAPEELRGYTDGWSPVAKSTLAAWKYALGGGTSEIQLSIIGERGLGLPREPEPGVMPRRRTPSPAFLQRPLPGLPEVEDFRVGLRQFVAAASTREKIRAVVDDCAPADAVDWGTAARQVGVQGLLVGEQQDALAIEVAACAAEELAAGLTPGPYISTILAGAAMSGLTGAALTAEAAAIARGDRRYVVDLASLGLDRAPRGAPVLRGGVLDGTVDHVVGSADADHLLVVLPGEDPVLCVVPLDHPAAARERVGSYDPTRPSSRLVLSGVPAMAATLDPERLAELQDLALTLLAAEQVGLIRHALESDVDYLMLREAFGRVVGSFQSVKHQLAEFSCEYELAVSHLEHAIAAHATTPSERRLATLSAFCVASRSAVRVTSEALRLLGAIGFTWEHDAHLYARRARVGESQLGSAPRLRHELARSWGLA